MKTIPQLIAEINQRSDTPLQRMGTLERREEEPGKPTYALSFSSEAPYERYWGIEILGHGPTEVKTDFISSGRAPLLLQHDADKQIGVVDSATISNGRGTAIIRFGAGALAKEIQQDVDDKVRGNVSVGYEILDMVLVRAGDKTKPDEYRVTSWRPKEISIVSIPADETVGVGRSSKSNQPPTLQVKSMTPEEQTALELQQRTAADNVAKDAVTKERTRIDKILELGRAHRLGDAADKAIREGAPVGDFQAQVLDLLAKGHKPLGEKYDALSSQEKKDVAAYSMRNAINGAMRNGNLTGIEAEMAKEAEREASQAGIKISGVGVPYVVLHRNWMQRAVTTGLAAANEGANLIADQLEAGSFIDILRARLVLAGLGARMLTGLVGNVDIPRKTAGVSGAWVEEDEALTDEAVTLGQLSLTPKRCGTTLPYTKQFLMQSSLSVEQMIRDEFASALAVKLEHAAVNGGGTTEPVGILNLGTNSNPSAIGTHGGALTYAQAVKLETLVANANADRGRLAYLTNPGVRGFGRVTEAFATTGRTIFERDNTINGYPAGVSTMVPANLTKGTSTALCSALIFGNWEDLLIATWGGLDIVVDEFTGAKKGLVQVTANMFADVGTRYPKAFAFTPDILLA